MDSSDEEYVMENGLLKYILINEQPFREEWVCDYFANKDVGEYKQIFPDLIKNPEKFFDYFRMTPNTFYYILEKIAPQITKSSNFRVCVSPEEKLMVTLKFLGHGNSFRSLGLTFKLAANTVRSIVYDTCEAICHKFLTAHMPVPTKASLEESAQEFLTRWKFPNCVGCIDGKHVRIRKPAHSASMYFNYKHFFSVILQGVADSNCKFISIDIGGYGRQSDSGIFQACPLYQQIQSGTIMPDKKPLPYSNESATTPIPHVLLADQGYPLQPYLMKPYNRKNADDKEQLFNYKLSSVRRVIECAFGILTAKWRFLKTEIQCELHNVDLLVKCSCLLHNIIIDLEGNPDVDNFQESQPLPTFMPSHDLRRYNRSTEEAVKVRNAFTNYFHSVNQMK